MIATEKAALERRIDELCADVERLRNQLHDQQDTAEHNFVRNAREYKRVCDENAKLLELANGYEALTATLCNERECDGCPFNDPEQIVCEHMRLQTCLRELGIEVPA